MRKVEVPVSYDVQLRLSEHGPEHTVRILDADAETIVLRVPPYLVSDDATPEQVMLSYGFKNFLWQVPAAARAVYDHWWFIERPNDEDCRRFQRRAFVRIAFESSVAVLPMRMGGNRSPINVRTENLSANGCLAVSDRPLGNPGDPLMVRLSLPGMPDISAFSEVARVMSETPTESCYGIHFKGLKGPVQEQLAQYVAERIRNHLSQGVDITLAERN